MLHRNEYPDLSPIDLHNYLEYTQDILQGLSKNIKVNFGGIRNFCQPYEQDFLPRRPKMTLTFRVKCDTKLHKKQNMSKKIRPWPVEDFLGPKVTTTNFWSRQKFLGVRA